MIRFPPKSGPKGSQKWIQKLMNGKPEFLNSEIKNQLTLPVDQSINWLSPEAEDNYAKYGDQTFLDILDIRLRRIPLSNFWASRRPAWDGLGRSKTGKVFFTDFSSRLLG